jgi:hypothetical protein
MTTFDKREQDFENKFAHDQKLSFKIEARASKLLGQWVAGKMGLTGDDAAKYAMDLVSANLEEPGYDDVLRKASADLKAKKIDVSDHMLKVEMDKLADEARKQIMAEGGKA